jgi:CheY-like chemotaxis protein
MSHELRTPLNAILGFSELMSLDETVTEKQKETLGIINRSGVHLLSMINDVLDISKIEAGRLELNIQAFDLIKFLEDIYELIKGRAANKRLEFVLEIAPDIQRFIKADSGKLRQVLINLLGNAIKFTHQGSVTLHAYSQPLPDEMTTLTIEVVDSGVGIPVEKQGEIFKPFVQITQENLDTQGTGLGLVISKSLVELMSGNISLKSEFGHGSTFKIQFPAMVVNVTDMAIEENTLAAKSLVSDQPTWRLLVVDDNDDNRLLLVSILTSMNFQVREAANGQEAIRVFEEWQPHLIWMDMRMPVMDGYEATKKIRKMAGGDKVKIIALTASTLKEQRQDIIDTECDAVIYKPFSTPKIFAALVKYLGVKFIYHDAAAFVVSPTIKITPEMLTQVPVNLRQQLRNAALNLDTEEIDLIIAQIRLIVPEIADALEELAKDYHFEQIIQLTESVD